ncbi:MAG: leucine-rich repeat domain-containing protein [Marinilabiliaceae bacterium]
MTTHRTLFLTAILCATSLTARGQISQYADPETGLLYETDASGVTTVSCPATNITTISGTVTIPAYVPDSNSPVDEIKMEGFKGATGITKVIIEGKGVKVCNYAFSGCNNIESVDVTGSISYIGQSAFYQASGLKSINLPEDLTKIDQYAFYECSSLTSLTTPSTLTSIGKEAFRRCTQLSSLNLAEGLERIEADAFREDLLIAKLILPSTTKYIGSSAFYSNNSIKEITIPKSVSEIAEWAFYDCTALEKITFEGGGELTTIPSRAFAGCESLEEIAIGDGVTTIDDYAFSTCTKLKTLTLPSSTEILGENIFSGCTSLETVKIYASSAPEFVTDCFKELPSTAKLLVPTSEAYASFKEYFGGGIENLYTFEEVEVEGSDKPEFGVTDGQSFLDIFSALADTEGDYANANVDIMNDIAFEPKSLDLNALSASNIFTALDRLPTVGNYSGTMNGSTISNLTVRSAGLFGSLDNGAQINGLIFDNATVYVDPTDTTTFEKDGDDVTIHLLAKKNGGKVTNFGFSGNIIVDSEYAKGKEISVCAVNEASEDSEINGFIRIGDILGTGDNKRCITIKQNLGVKRPTSKKIKMATSKSLSSDNKSLSTDFTYSDEELMRPVRAFSDEEFAKGAVAYWLNYAGPGYTGKYTAYWSQGKTVPVPAQTIGGVSNALYAVDYGSTDLRHITSAPQFANNGSQITIAYDSKPTKVTVGDQQVTGFGDKSMSVTFDHTKPISIVFASATSSATIKQGHVKASVSGREITISGADGAEKTLINLVGTSVARTNGRSLTAPSKGIYLVKVGGKVIKIAVK